MADHHWQTADFDYPLPEELIAQTPSNERGGSRLLVLDPERELADPEAMRDLTFNDIAELIPPGDLLVVNSTKVRHARLLGKRPSGRPAEVLLLHPTGRGSWLAMGKPGKALKVGKRIHLSESISIETVAEDVDGFREVRFIGCSAEEAMGQVGRLPLPPYIQRDPDEQDEGRYQTVYADREGSVAAPTAGLHFTDRMLGSLRDSGIEVTDLDLEVGPGTFKPVESENPRDHHMHRESFEISQDTVTAIDNTRARGGAVWAVGTTVVRALESAADGRGSVRAEATSTDLMILPGHRFQVVDRLITNFHLPRSTLLMLVSAFAGHQLVMAGYRHAVEARYRFYSYGDAMCIVSRAT